MSCYKIKALKCTRDLIETIHTSLLVKEFNSSFDGKSNLAVQRLAASIGKFRLN